MAGTVNVTVTTAGGTSAIAASDQYTYTGSASAYVTKWGSYGSGDGQFNAPSDIAVDTGGDVYVADPNNNRIQKFSSSGAYVAQWGSPGSGNGQFNAPNNVAVDGSGNVYVTDSGNNRIQEFTSSGVYVTQWGSPVWVMAGSGLPGILRSVQTGMSMSRIPEITGSRSSPRPVVYVTQWGSGGSGNGQFSSPLGVAVDAGGHVYVVDYGNNRIQEFTSSGAYVTQWGSSGSGSGQFSSPQSIAVDGIGNVYVADTNNYRVQEFSSSGAHEGTWGSDGSGDGQFISPCGIAVDGIGNV